MNCAANRTQLYPYADNDTSKPVPRKASGITESFATPYDEASRYSNNGIWASGRVLLSSLLKE